MGEHDDAAEARAEVDESIGRAERRLADHRDDLVDPRGQIWRRSSRQRTIRREMINAEHLVEPRVTIGERNGEDAALEIASAASTRLDLAAHGVRVLAERIVHARSRLSDAGCGPPDTPIPRKCRRFAGAARASSSSVNAIGLSALVLGSLLVSCTPPREVVQATATPASAVPARVQASTPGYLVWTRGEHGALHTVLLDETAKKLGEVDTVLLAADGRISALVRTSASRQLPSCDPSGGSADMGPSAEESLGLVRLDDDESRTIMKPYFSRPGGEHDSDQIQEIGTVTQSADVAGSVGPYLFLDDSIWQYACGAHGLWSQSSRVVDARSGAEVKLSAVTGDNGEAAARAQFVKLAKDNEGLDSLWTGGDPGEIQHVAVEPRLTEGRFGLVDIYVAGVPYAFGEFAVVLVRDRHRSAGDSASRAARAPRDAAGRIGVRREARQEAGPRRLL